MNSFPENPEAVPEALSGQASDLAAGPPMEPGCAIPQHSSWWDVFVLVVLTVLSVVLLVVSVLATVAITKKWIYPYLGSAEIVRLPLVALFAQASCYVLVLACMYLLVTRVQDRPDVLAAIHWNWPSNPGWYLFAGLLLSVALQVLAHWLPVPKNLPIDNMFRTPAEAWALSIFGTTLAPLMEELYFRGFLYPALSRRIGIPGAVLLTAVPFALLHVAQLGFAWGPVLVIFLVGMVLTMVRAKTNSVAAGLLIHMAYNGTITVAMFAATDGFRHLEKLNQ